MLDAAATRPVPVGFPPEGVFVLESRHGRGFVMPDTAHDYLKVLLVFKGAGALRAGRRRLGLARGDVAIVPAGCLHRIEDSGGSPLSLYAVCVRREVLAQVPGAIGGLGNLRVLRHPLWSGELAVLLRTLLVEQSREAPGKGAWVTGLAWQVLGLVWRAGVAGKPEGERDAGGVARARVAAYARELPRRFHEESSLAAAAERLGLGRRRFTDLFREAAGDSWLRVVRRLRVEHAKRLLRETERSVAAVAFEAGFEDLSHFYRVFRAEFPGLTPEVWRRRSASRRAAGK